MYGCLEALFSIPSEQACLACALLACSFKMCLFFGKTADLQQMCCRCCVDTLFRLAWISWQLYVAELQMTSTSDDKPFCNLEGCFHFTCALKSALEYVSGVPVHCRGVGPDGPQKSLPTLRIYDLTFVLS